MSCANKTMAEWDMPSFEELEAAPYGVPLLKEDDLDPTASRTNTTASRTSMPENNTVLCAADGPTELANSRSAFTAGLNRWNWVRLEFLVDVRQSCSLLANAGARRGSRRARQHDRGARGATEP